MIEIPPSEISSERETVVIAMSTDDNYLPYLRVTLQSFLEHISGDEVYELVVLYSGDNTENVRMWLKDCHRSNLIVDVKDMSDYRHYSFYTSKHISMASYDRLYLPSILPQRRKVLYLDCDLIVLDDVAPLFHTEMGNNYIAGVRDECFVYAKSDLLRMARREHLSNGATSNINHINAGVLLMNLHQIREERIDKAWLKFAEGRNLVFHDQSVLNIICEGRITLIDEAWNFQIHNRLHEPGIPSEIIRSAEQRLHEGNYKIVHYSTTEKPWFNKCSPLAYLWWMYAKKTPIWSQLCSRFICPYRTVKWRTLLILLLSLVPIHSIHRFCLTKLRRSYLKPMGDYAEWLEMQEDHLI